jgi:N utilization substance protein A
VAKIIMDEDEKTMEVIVPDDQLSLAIGKKGQNVRLASRLTVWKLDVRSEAEAEEEARRGRASLIAIPGIGDVTAEYLLQEGFKSAEKVAESDIETLQEIEGIDPEKAAQVLQSAREHVAALRKAEEEARAAAAAAEAERVRALLMTVSGIDGAAADKLAAARIDSIEAVRDAGASRLAEILEADPATAESIAAAAEELLVVASAEEAGEEAVAGEGSGEEKGSGESEA